LAFRTPANTNDATTNEDGNESRLGNPLNNFFLFWMMENYRRDNLGLFIFENPKKPIDKTEQGKNMKRNKQQGYFEWSKKGFGGSCIMADGSSF
jgi:hypothetical protein